MARSGRAKDVHEDGKYPMSKPVQGRPKIPSHCTSDEHSVKREREAIEREDRKRRGGG